MTVTNKKVRRVVVEGSPVEYYRGYNLSDDQIASLVKLQQAKAEGLTIGGLENCLLNLSDDVAERLNRGDVTLSDLDEEDIQYGTLRDYQVPGVLYQEIAQRTLVAYSVGLGKTAIFAGLLRRLYMKAEKKYAELYDGEKMEGAPFRFLFLSEVSQSTLNQVHKEIVKFSGFNTLKMTGRKNDIDPWVDDVMADMEQGIEGGWSMVASNTVINNARFRETLDAFEEKFGKPYFNVICVDEFTNLYKGNKKTQTYQNLEWLFNQSVGKSPTPKYITTLTATPFESKLETMYRALDLLDPTMLPPQTTFRENHCNMVMGGGGFKVPDGTYKNVEEFSKAVSLRVIRYSREDVGSVQVESTVAALVTDLTPIQKKISKVSSQRGMVFSAPNHLDSDLGLRDISKMQALDLLFSTVLKYEEETCMIYAHNLPAQAAVQEFLNERGISSIVINGQTSSKETVQGVQEFKDGKYQVLITNLERGLNLPEISNMVFYQIPRSPSRIIQIEGRMIRTRDIVNKHLWLLPTRGVQDSELDILMNDVRELTDSAIKAQGRDVSLFYNFCDKPVLVDVSRYIEERKETEKSLYDLVLEGGHGGVYDEGFSAGHLSDDENVEVLDLESMGLEGFFDGVEFEGEK